jgi:hypothetical protein
MHGPPIVGLQAAGLLQCDHPQTACPTCRCCGAAAVAADERRLRRSKHRRTRGHDGLAHLRTALGHACQHTQCAGHNRVPIPQRAAAAGVAVGTTACSPGRHVRRQASSRTVGAACGRGGSQAGTQVSAACLEGLVTPSIAGGADIGSEPERGLAPGSERRGRRRILWRRCAQELHQGWQAVGELPLTEWARGTGHRRRARRASGSAARSGARVTRAPDCPKGSPTCSLNSANSPAFETSLAAWEAVLSPFSRPCYSLLSGCVAQVGSPIFCIVTT